jgi:hypothetical protein
MLSTCNFERLGVKSHLYSHIYYVMCGKYTDPRGICKLFRLNKRYFNFCGGVIPKPSVRCGRQKVS